MMLKNQNGGRGNWRNRLWSWAGDNLVRYGGLLEASVTPGGDQSESDVPRPVGEYVVRRAYRDNRQLYRRLHAWGLVEHPWRTVYNPVPAVVAFYLAHTLAGEVEVLPQQRAAAEAGSGQARDAALLAAVGQVQERSNWMVFRHELVEAAAVEGDVFVKAAERVDEDGVVSGVYLQRLPATAIRRCEVDERGYVQALRIDIPRYDSVFGGRSREHMLVEVWDDEGVRFHEVEGHRTVQDDELPPAVAAQAFADLQYDFIPVVWARCATPWWDVVDQIDERNRLAWLLGRLNRPLMIVSANAVDSRGFPMPAPAVAEKERPAYEEVGHGAAAMMRLPGQATAAWSGAPVDFGAMQQEIAALQEHVEGSLPEYFVAARLQAVQVAADTLQMLLAQAGQRVLEMRWTLEAALERAQMMALTLGQVAGLAGFAPTEIGTYDAGDFGHTFAERPVFEKSAAARAAEAAALVAAGATIEGAARVAGYSDQQVEDLVNLSIATFPEEERDDA